ncbi:BamA/TamA family outer membrane protein, partial [candidate division KSB1 bacterium]
FRFPFIRYMQAGLPLPIFLSNIGGAVFMDMGVAWDDDETFKLYSATPDDESVTLFSKAPNRLIRAQDLLATIGFGLRINLGIFLMRVDFAWPTDFYRTSKEMEILWSLGADF